MGNMSLIRTALLIAVIVAFGLAAIDCAPAAEPRASCRLGSANRL